VKKPVKPVKSRQAWSGNHSLEEIAKMIGCTGRTIQRKREKNLLLWENSIIEDEVNPRKWKILSSNIEVLKKAVLSAK